MEENKEVLLVTRFDNTLLIGDAQEAQRIIAELQTRVARVPAEQQQQIEQLRLKVQALAREEKSLLETRLNLQQAGGGLSGVVAKQFEDRLRAIKDAAAAATQEVAKLSGALQRQPAINAVQAPLIQQPVKLPEPSQFVGSSAISLTVPPKQKIEIDTAEALGATQELRAEIRRLQDQFLTVKQTDPIGAAKIRHEIVALQTQLREASGTMDEFGQRVRLGTAGIIQKFTEVGTALTVAFEVGPLIGLSEESHNAERAQRALAIAVGAQHVVQGAAAAAELVHNRALIAQRIATVSASVGQGLLAAATSVGTAALSFFSVAMTAATGGLNLIIPVLLALGGYMVATAPKVIDVRKEIDLLTTSFKEETEALHEASAATKELFDNLKAQNDLAEQIVAARDKLNNTESVTELIKIRRKALEDERQSISSQRNLHQTEIFDTEDYIRELRFLRLDANKEEKKEIDEKIEQQYERLTTLRLQHKQETDELSLFTERERLLYLQSLAQLRDFRKKQEELNRVKVGSVSFFADQVAALEKDLDNLRRGTLEFDQVAAALATSKRKLEVAQAEVDRITRTGPDTINLLSEERIIEQRLEIQQRFVGGSLESEQQYEQQLQEINARGEVNRLEALVEYYRSRRTVLLRNNAIDSAIVQANDQLLLQTQTELSESAINLIKVLSSDVDLGSLTAYGDKLSQLETQLKNTSLAAVQFNVVNQAVQTAREANTAAEERYKDALFQTRNELGLLTKSEADAELERQKTKQLQPTLDFEKFILEVAQGETANKLMESNRSRHNRAMEQLDRDSHPRRIRNWDQYNRTIEALQKASEIRQLQAQIDFLQKLYDSQTNKMSQFAQATLAELRRLQSVLNQTLAGLESGKPKFLDYFTAIANAGVQAANMVLQAFAEMYRGQTEAQNRRIEEAKAIAERGNAEFLEREQDRLDQLQRKQENFVKAQQALNLLLAISNIVVAIAKAASQSGVLAPAAIAEVIAAVGVGIAAGVAMFAGKGFREGGHTGDGKSTDVAGPVHKNEFVFRQEQTQKYREVFEKIHTGKMDLLQVVHKSQQYDLQKELHESQPNISGMSTMVVVHRDDSKQNAAEMRALRKDVNKIVAAIENQERLKVMMTSEGLFLVVSKVESDENFRQALAAS